MLAEATQIDGDGLRDFASAAWLDLPGRLGCSHCSFVLGMFGRWERLEIKCVHEHLD